MNVEVIVLFVLLALLSGVVWYSVRHITHQSDVAVCTSNVTLLNTSVEGLRIENGLAEPTTAAGWRAAMLPGSAYVGAPFISSWPSSTSYVLTIAGQAEGRDTGDGHVPANGDVLVTVSATGLRYDATAREVRGCADL
jgi:hypothetical protein